MAQKFLQAITEFPATAPTEGFTTIGEAFAGSAFDFVPDYNNHLVCFVGPDSLCCSDNWGSFANFHPGCHLFPDCYSCCSPLFLCCSDNLLDFVRRTADFVAVVAHPWEFVLVASNSGMG